MIIHGDALSSEVWEALPGDYDLILGNPPFLATGNFETRERLEERFKTARGRFDYSYLFVEQGISKLKRGGLLGMVVPNRLYRNRDAGLLREIAARDTSILTVVDFGVAELFQGATTYIGALILQRRLLASQRETRVIRVLKLPPRFLSALLITAARSSKAELTDYLESYNSAIPQGTHSWTLLSERQRRARLRLEEASVELSAIAGIYQGIRTGANDIFIVELVSQAPGPLRQVRNGLGDVSIVEAAALKPVIFGADIKRYDRLPSRSGDLPERFIIYPYIANAQITEHALKETFPRTHEYLKRFQSLLDDRTSIAGTGLRWFDLVRRRDEAWLMSPKLVTRDLALRASFAADLMGDVFLVGGTAVVPADVELLIPLLGYLNSEAANWYLAQATPTFRSGFQKIEPQHLQGLPVPKGLVDVGDTQEQIAKLAMNALDARGVCDDQLAQRSEEQIDEIVCELVGIKREDIRLAPL